jgi:hypothetical protein
MQKMKANVFRSANNIRVGEVPRPSAGAGEAVVRITLTPPPCLRTTSSSIKSSRPMICSVRGAEAS